MLIRWATESDKSEWIDLAKEVSLLFGNPTMSTDKAFLNYMDAKVRKYEALVAIDRMSGRCHGIISFSRTHNRITWLGVSQKSRGKRIGTRLLATALRHLDTSKEITVKTFREDDAEGIPAHAIYKKFGFVAVDNTLSDDMGNPRCKMAIPPTHIKKGKSFHYDYPKYAKFSKKEYCLCCNNHPAPETHVDILELTYSYATAERIAQGRLFGKCHVLSKLHVVDFEEMPHEDMAGFMREVQIVAKALHKITGAIKINYEIHANTGPHLHCHLFPRYLDDDFPSAPIDYRLTDPSPYESEEEFRWFVEEMKKQVLANLKKTK